MLSEAEKLTTRLHVHAFYVEMLHHASDPHEYRHQKPQSTPDRDETQQTFVYGQFGRKTRRGIKHLRRDNQYECHHCQPEAKVGNS